MKRVLLPLFFLLVCVGMATPAHAQFAQTENVVISVSPKYPRPNELVTVTVSSTLINLSASSISISVDGEVVREGSRSAQIRVGKAGEKTTVTATAITNGNTYTKTVAIVPTDVALVVEPLTTAHALYEGAGLVAPESRVRLIAISDMRTGGGTRIPDSQLSYTWRLGDQILNNQSGLGKNVLEATSPVRYRDAQVSVTVSTQDASQTAYAKVFISPVAPLVRIYRTNPLEGPDFAHALSGTYPLAGSEDTFLAVPYFFAKTPVFSWTLNGTKSSAEDTITVRTTGANAGTALLGVLATNGLEGGESRFTLQFGSNAKNIFGF